MNDICHVMLPLLFSFALIPESGKRITPGIGSSPCQLDLASRCRDPNLCNWEPHAASVQDASLLLSRVSVRVSCRMQALLVLLMFPRLRRLLLSFVFNKLERRCSRGQSRWREAKVVMDLSLWSWETHCPCYWVLVCCCLLSKTSFGVAEWQRWVISR